MPLTGLLFVVYICSIVALSVARHSERELSWLILLYRVAQAVLMFSILYTCKCV
jgi:hypothetical protein